MGKHDSTFFYAVLSRETTKDWVKDTKLEKLCNSLEEAIVTINRLIKWYIDDYQLEDEFENKIPTVSMRNVSEDLLEFGLPVEIINVKSPKDEITDPNQDGMWGNFRIYIQKIKKPQ